eukprot:s1104_g19.t1
MTGVCLVQRKIDVKFFSCSRVPDGGHALIAGEDLPAGCVSVYGAKVMDTSDLLILSLDGDSWWAFNSDLGDSLSPHVLDLCAGTGAMSLAAKYLGANPMLAVDWNFKAIELLQQNHPGVALHLDLTSDDAALLIHQACEQRPGTVFLGFPCQPHSSQGQGLGCNDPRAKVLWHGLHITFMLQAQSLILECTPLAGENETIQAALATLAEAMGWVIQTVNLDLLEVWPCRRHLWWAILFPKHWHQFDLVPWALNSPFDSIGKILPAWGHWSSSDEAALQLTPAELAMYHDPTYGHDVRKLELDSIAATFLHSYANALSACPCGCRLKAFHPMTLRSGGLRGQYTISKETGTPRFLHPKEVALLLGLPGSFTFRHDVRTSLALLGLVASPLQAIWIYGYLLRNHRVTVHHVPCPQVEDWLQAYIMELLVQAPRGFPSASMHWTLDFHAHGAPLTFRCNTIPVIAQQLLLAERISLGWNESCALLNHSRRLGLDACLTADQMPALQLYCQTEVTDRVRPEQLIAVAVQHQDCHQVHLVQPGRFLFEILNEMQLPLIRKVIDSKDQILPVDFRVWRPMAVTTLVECPWHQPVGSFICANGPASDLCLGLHDGQIWACIGKLLQHAPQPACSALILHPAFAAALMTHWITPHHCHHLQTRFLESNGCILCIFEADGHWTLLHGWMHNHCLSWTLYDGLLQPASSSALCLIATLSGILGLDFCPPTVQGHVLQLDPHTCGSVALAHLCLLLHPGHWISASSILPLHQWILQQPGLSGSIFATGITELSTDQVEKLKQLLLDHGVPDSKVSDRVQQVIHKLGAPAIVAAFVAKTSWAHLKAQANKPGLAFRLVQPDELARHAERTAALKYGAGISHYKNKKKVDKSPAQIPQFAPADLVLQPGHFRDEDGDIPPQISFADIEAEAYGIAITTNQEGYQWLQQSSSISSRALAILTTEELPADFMTKHDIAKIAFPATYKGTGEPVLLFGCLKNLGDKKINRHKACAMAPVDIIANVVVRLHVYRDELQAPWDDLVKSPVRLLSSLLLPLQLCQGQGRGPECQKTHPAVGETLDSVIMEVWGRSFGKIQGGRAAAPESTYFSVFLRVPETCLQSLLQIYVQGIYIDPRKDKEPDDRFRVVGLSAHSLAEALHACKTCLKALGLVRLRFKYGLRVAVADEETAFKQLKPEATFIATRVQRTFQLFPLPHGLQRSGLIKILSDLQWTAKPLQPGRGQQDGISWQVGSSEPPPVNVFTSFDKEVLITETTKKAAETKSMTFLASSRTQKHLRTEASSSSHRSPSADPWQDSDPWHGFKPTTGDASVAPANSGKRHLVEVTGQIREELQASMRKELEAFKSNHDAAMQDVSPDHEVRFQKIESTLEEIQAQQGQFSQWFSQVGQASTATENAIQTIQYTLSTHQQDLQGLHQEVKTVSDNVSTTLQKTLATHQTAMSEDFAARFDKLEAMFAKKQRSE